MNPPGSWCERPKPPAPSCELPSPWSRPKRPAEWCEQPEPAVLKVVGFLLRGGRR